MGAANMDITGDPSQNLLAGDSNPGKVLLSAGGVGRNIAEGLSRLGWPVSLITALGNDDWAERLRRDCTAAGIDLQNSVVYPSSRTSTYLCINDAAGNVAAAVADMQILELLSPAMVAPLVPALNTGAAVVLDANLREDTLCYLAEHLTVPIAADSVSARKAGKLKPILRYLSVLKPSIPEAEQLTGMQIRDDEELRAAAERLIELGVKRVFLSLGSRGVYATDGEQAVCLPCVPGKIINTNGCGDVFLAAAIAALLDGWNTEKAARYALTAAAVNAGSKCAVSTELSREKLLGMLE